MGLSHRPRPGQRRRQAASDRRLAEALRKCCPTHFMEPHTPTCRDRPRRCRSKLPYTSRVFARAAAAAKSARLGLLTEYRCPHCGLWHIGHPAPGEKGWDLGEAPPR